MSRLMAAAILALSLGLAAGPVVAQQNSLPSRTLPSDARNPNTAGDRLRDRELPKLQDRDDMSDVPLAQRDRFEAYCKTRGGCPGGYAQHQGEFAAYEQRQIIEQRRDMERKVLRDQRIGIGTPRTQ